MNKDATVSIRLPGELRELIAKHAAANHRTLGSQVLYYIEQGMDKPRTVKRISGVQKPDEVSDQVWDDFCKLRASKKAPLTESALQQIKTQANLAMWTLDSALAETCARGWTSFKAEWVNKASKQQALEASNRQAAEEFING
tara:strand:- start:22 stop:447 length:426 start_codon:yes stop_codon:yes gene_type:complete